MIKDNLSTLVGDFQFLKDVFFLSGEVQNSELTFMGVITFKDKYLDILGGNSSDEAVCLINWSALCLFPPLRKTMSPYLKNYDEFSCMFEIAN